MLAQVAPRRGGRRAIPIEIHRQVESQYYAYSDGVPAVIGQIVGGTINQKAVNSTRKGCSVNSWQYLLLLSSRAFTDRIPLRREARPLMVAHEAASLFL